MLSDIRVDIFVEDYLSLHGIEIQEDKKKAKTNTETIRPEVKKLNYDPASGNGSGLENFVYSQLKYFKEEKNELKGSDLAKGIKIVPKEGVENISDIDVAWIVDGKFISFECKCKLKTPTIAELSGTIGQISRLKTVGKFSNLYHKSIIVFYSRQELESGEKSELEHTSEYTELKEEIRQNLNYDIFLLYPSKGLSGSDPSRRTQRIADAKEKFIGQLNKLLEEKDSWFT